MKRQVRITLLVTICIVGLVFAGVALAHSGGTFEIPPASIKGGGGGSSGGSFTVTGAAGQPAVQSSSGALFLLKSGFWQTSNFRMIYVPLIRR